MDSQFVLIANAKDGTISTFEHSGGDLKPLAVSEVGAPGMPLAVDPANNLVFAGGSDPQGVTVLRLDRASGELEVLGRYETRGVPSYLTLSSDAGLLFSASYHQGLGEVFRVGDAGALSPVGEPLEYRNLHCVQLSSDDNFAYFASLRDDLVAQYAVAPDGELTPLDPPTVSAPPGSGPRHLILNPAETSAYLTTEYAGVALHYRRDPVSGLLDKATWATAIPTDRGLSHSRFGADPRAEDLIWCSDLHLSGSGRLLYVAERTRGTITAVEVAAETGELGEALATSDVVTQPRGFRVLDNDDLLVASELDRVVAVYRADADGALTEVARHQIGLGANWIEVVRR